MSYAVVSINTKTKTKGLFEGKFICSNCHKATQQKLLSVKRDLNIYGLMPIGRLENTNILQCQECGVEKELDIKKEELDKSIISNKIKELLKNKEYTFYNKNLKECRNCGYVINAFENAKIQNFLKCPSCKKDISYLIEEANFKKAKHSETVIIILVIIGVLLLLQFLGNQN